MKKFLTLALAAVMALSLAACGGDSSSSAPAGSSAAGSSAAAGGSSAADDGIGMASGNVEEHSLQAIKAVSYTHLDVYKRQELGTGTCHGPPCQPLPGGLCGAPAPFPVCPPTLYDNRSCIFLFSIHQTIRP